MIDLFSSLSLLFSILILGSFFLLLIMQISSYNNKKIENLFFIISITAGTIAIISYIFDTVLWEKEQNAFIRENLQSSLFFFFTICFYFWFKHYSEIIFLKTRSKESNFMILGKFNRYLDWLEPIGIIDSLFLIGLVLDLAFYFADIFNFYSVFDIFWGILGIDNRPGRYVTFISSVAFLSGFIFFYITYIIMKNNLVELGKVSQLELISIVPLGFSNFILLMNNIFLTYGYYEPSFAALFINIGLFMTFFSLIVLLINYILANPSHIQSPSLYKDIAKLIDTIDDPSFIDEVSKEKEKRDVSNKLIEFEENFDMPQKLNGTCILILIYLMKNISLNTLAKDLETNLNLNKSTISYNLKILEKFEFIKRLSPLEVKLITNPDSNQLDQRQKFISINQNGKTFLIQLHDYLGHIFQ